MGWKNLDITEAPRYDQQGQTLTPICFFNVPAFADHDNPHWLAELPSYETAFALGYYLVLNPDQNPYADQSELTQQLIGLLNSLHQECRRNDGFDRIHQLSPKVPCLDPRVHKAYRTPVVYRPENHADWRVEGRAVPDWLAGWAGDFFVYIPTNVLGASIDLRNKFYTEFSQLMDEELKRTYHWLRLYQLYAENQSKER